MKICPGLPASTVLLLIALTGSDTLAPAQSGTAPAGGAAAPRALPVLAGRWLRPTGLPASATERGSPSPGLWELPEAEWPVESPGFASAEAAYDAARAWLKAHVLQGVPEGSVQLEFDPFDAKYNTVFCHQVHAGVQAGGNSWIQFRGTTPVKGNVNLYELVPVVGSEKPIVAPEAARAAYEQALANVGSSLDAIAKKGSLTILPVAQLHYHESLERREQEIDGRKFNCVFQPIWHLDKDGYYLGVDAHSGVAWYEFESNKLPTKAVTGSEWKGKPPTTGAPMELWRGKLLSPVADADSFDPEGSTGYRYPKVRQTPKRAAEDPYPTDEEAVQAVKDWVAKHFGPLPAGSQLVATSVQHSASGMDKPAYDWDRGHTIVLRQDCSGFPTDNTSIVYLTGRTVFQGTIRIADLKPIAGSAAPTVTKDIVRKIVRGSIEASGGSGRQAALTSLLLFPHLEYRYSIVHRAGAGDDGMVLAPTWVLGRHGDVLVDAITGRIWRDD